MISWELADGHRQVALRRGEHIRANAVLLLMLAALPIQERHAYELVRTTPWITTADLGRRMKISNNHAWAICNRLHQVHLLSYRQGQNLIKTWHVQ